MSTPHSLVPTRSDGTALPEIRIQILHVRDCPFVDGVRRVLDRCLAMTVLHVNLEEIEGPYSSPTILINGVDATGQSAPSGVSCRLDVPTAELIMAALNKITERV